MIDTPNDDKAERGQRGPADHVIRQQIVTAANEHFSHFGYGKTTVSDLAKAIGFSKAYIYKFFNSKQAIGEAICAQCLASIVTRVVRAIAKEKTAAGKLRRMFSTITNTSVKLFLADRKLYEITVHSLTDRWHSATAYEERLEELLRQILIEGRESHEFERKTPLDENCRAILQAMAPYTNPLLLQHNLNGLPASLDEVTNLVLRSLAP